MSPPFPNPAQQAGQQAMQTNQLQQHEQFVRRNAQQRGSRGGISAAGFVFGLVAFVVFLAVVAIIVTTVLSRMHIHM